MRFTWQNSIPIIILLVALATGIGVYDDFGVSWDEKAKMLEMGKATLEFVAGGDAETYVSNPEKYHGPAFEVILYGLQEVFNKTNPPDAYYFRHLLCFLLYWIAGIAFYIFLRREFGNPFIQIVGLAWYFLMPRLFPDAFYNSMDMAFFCINIFGLLTFRNFISRPGYASAGWHALVCGFAIGIRVLGILLPVLTAALFVLKLLKDYEWKICKSQQQGIKYLAAFAILCSGFTILFWPVLWLNPVTHLIGAFNEMRFYQWGAYVRYAGEFIVSTDLPWHYTFVWMGVTIPELYLIFFGIGIFSFVSLMIRSGVQSVMHNMNALYALLAIGVSLSAVIILHSVIYDGWRHFYYLYSYILVISLCGLEAAIRWAAKSNRWWVTGFKITVVTATAFIGYEMIMMHPYQHVYFNRVSHISNPEHRFDFELDYWGLTYKEAVEKVLIKDKRDTLKLSFSNLSGPLGLNILEKTDRDRIVVSDSAESDYYITNYRWRDEEITSLKCVDSIETNGLIISKTFLIRGQ